MNDTKRLNWLESYICQHPTMDWRDAPFEVDASAFNLRETIDKAMLKPFYSRHPAQTLPPRHFILEEMETRGWQEFDLVMESGLRPLEVYQLLYKGREITPELAGGLAKAFGVSAQLFLNLEKAYQEHKEKL